MKQLFTLVLLCLGFTCTTHAQESEYLPGEVIVMLAPGAEAEAIATDLRELHGVATGLHVVKELSAPMRAWLLRFDNPILDQEAVLRAVQQHPAVLLAQNNHVVHERNTPNDPQFGSQWQHVNIDSEAAWDITTGGVTTNGDTIVVAIMENADLPHPDLVANMWHNYDEVPGNGIDDDANGYVDDFQGWNTAGGDDNVYGGSHGTSVAGMIGATGDNALGVVGANWHVKMMPVTYSALTDAAVMEVYTYPLIMRRLYNQTGGTKGAFVVSTNASWGIDGGNHNNFPLWCAIYDSLGTEGVLNCGATANNNVDIDVVDDMPTGCESDFMISVTATNDVDVRTFSGWGATTIDVGAPGANIFTTTIGGGYGSTSGTSFASPLTAGVIALLYSAPCDAFMDIVDGDPEEGALYIRQALFAGVEQVGNLPGNTVTGGRINSFNSLQWIMNQCGACPGAYNLGSMSPMIGTSILSWESFGGTDFNMHYHAVGDTTWIDLGSVTTPYYLSGLDSCTAYEYEVSTLCDTIVSGWSNTYTWTSEGCCLPPTNLIAGFAGENSANATWGSVMAATNYEVRISVSGSGSWFNYTTTFDFYEFTGLTPCTDYDVQVRTDCSGSPTPWSDTLVLHTIGCGACLDNTYCQSISASTTDEWIDRVQLATLDNTSGDNGGYGDYTGVSTPLTIGGSYTITLTPGYAGTNYDEYFTVYMDLDQDGLLDGPGELVYDPGATTNAAITGNFTVPTTALPGITRMRVIMVFNQAPLDGCEDNYDYGETEDYCVEMVDDIGLGELDRTVPAQLFPNPADGWVTVAVSSTTQGSLFTLFDNSGRVVKRQGLQAGSNRIDVSRLVTGAYLWQLAGAGRSTARGQLIIAH